MTLKHVCHCLFVLFLELIVKVINFDKIHRNPEVPFGCFSFALISKNLPFCLCRIHSFDSVSNTLDECHTLNNSRQIFCRRFWSLRLAFPPSLLFRKNNRTCFLPCIVLLHRSTSLKVAQPHRLCVCLHYVQ